MEAPTADAAHPPAGAAHTAPAPRQHPSPPPRRCHAPSHRWQLFRASEGRRLGWAHASGEGQKQIDRLLLRDNHSGRR